ncbi:serine-type D-Ala-D-Ala carboxypeptidase DacF [soil metagenome]
MVAALIGAVVLCAPASAAGPPKDLPARSWIVVDASDGHVIAAQDPDQRSAIASTTKMMTAYLALRDLDPDKVVTAPPYAAAPGESLMGLEAGERVGVRDLLYGLLLPSGNDAASALATIDAGSVPKFVVKMNAAAKQLGLTETSYSTPVGLDDPDNYSTAHDLVSLALGLLQDPLFSRIVDTERITLDDGEVTRTLVNRNPLLGDAPYFDGVKTGFTADAGNVLVGSATKDGAHVVSAVLGSPTEGDRDSASRALLDYALSEFKKRTPVREGETVDSSSIAFEDGRLDLVAARNVVLTARQDQKLRVVPDAPDEVRGPIDRGEKVGTAIVRLDGKPVAHLRLLAAEAVGAPTIVDRADSGVPGSRAILYVLVVALAGAVVIGILRRMRRTSKG